MQTRRVILLIFLSIVVSRLMAQDINEHDFARYTRDEGLSSNDITSIAQDSTGYIWTATSYGLNRYNGSRFVQFHSRGDSLSLPAEEINRLVQLDSYRLAIATREGMQLINTATGETRNIIIPCKNKKYQYKFNNIVSVKSYINGDIILLTGSGLYHYNKECHLVYRYDHYPNERVESLHVNFGGDLLQLGDQRFLISSYLGLYIYDVVKHQVKKMDPADCPLLAEFISFPGSRARFFQQKKGCLFAILAGADSLMYIDIPRNKKTAVRLPLNLIKENNYGYRLNLFSINDSLFYLTGHHSGFYKIIFDSKTGNMRFFPDKYFSSYLCNGLLKDKNGNLWIATNKGLLKQDKRKANLQQVAVPASLESLFPDITMVDACPAGNKLYVCCRGSGGLLEFDKQSLQFTRRISFRKYFRKADFITSLLAVDGHTLLVGTNGPLFRLDLATGLETKITLDEWSGDGDWIVKLWKDSRGNIWVITNSNLYKYDAATGKCAVIKTDSTLYHKISPPAHAITEDNTGNIWIANEGLCRYNIMLNKFDRVIDSFPFIRMPDLKTRVIAGTKNDLWIIINNNGLINYSIATGKIHHFTSDNGLPNNTIYNMIIVDDKLWFTCYSNIGCLDLKTSRVTTFGKEDGFPDLPLINRGNFFYDTADRMLYITFSNTAVRFYPHRIFHTTPGPSVFIEDIAIRNQRNIYLPNGNITTSWNDNDIRITIGSINFLTGSSERFAYRLMKEDSTDWQQLGAQNTFSIASLSPGLHRVQVKLFSINNRWPDQVKEFTIRVLPPFWQTAWFKILAATLGALVIYILFIWKIDQIRKKEKEKTHIQRIKAEEYKTQAELEQISNYFSSSLAGKKNIEEILWDVTRGLIRRMGYTDCMVYLWNEDETRMLQKASFDPASISKADTGNIFEVMPGQGVIGQVILTKQPAIIPDTLKKDRYRAAGDSSFSAVCVPIIHNDSLLGILDLKHPELNYFKERDLKILMTIATLLGNKIKQLESEQSLQVKREELATINEQLAEAQLSALQTQMNPHFIFNALNGIKRMILVNDANNASRYLSKFALMIRLTLNQSKKVFATLRENIQYLESYLEMEKLRFDDSFTYFVETDEGLKEEEIDIPTLMIQPLVENAIWHGLMNIKGEKKIHILFSRNKNIFTCTIEDNGIGILQSEKLKKDSKTSHRSVGLENLRNRIHIMNEKYHIDCMLKIIDKSERGGRGTMATLSFKIVD